MVSLDGTASLFAGAVALGLVHGAEPGHGWPVAAAYALDRRRTWFHGFAASSLLGLGHLVSSVAVVLLIGLGIREYRHGHSHSHGHGDGEEEAGHSHDGDHDHSHDHDHGLSTDDVDEAGLWGIVTTAFVLGFAHEEEFEIIGLCLGSRYCLELMLVYALAVLVALVALTLLLVAGFERYGERVEGLAEHLPTVSAVVLVALGLGFIFGVV
jgi:hypothetical protein